MTKAEAREHFALRVQALNERQRRLESQYVCEQIINTSQFEQAKSVFVYIPFEHEVDVRKVFQQAWQNNKRVYVPVLKNGEMLAVMPKGELKKGAFGIMQPVEWSDECINPDFCVVPAAALTPLGVRLGRGKGYYDRFLQGKACYKVGVCFSVQLASELPHNEQDVIMDRVIAMEEQQ